MYYIVNIIYICIVLIKQHSAIPISFTSSAARLYNMKEQERSQKELRNAVLKRKKGDGWGGCVRLF